MKNPNSEFENVLMSVASERQPGSLEAERPAPIRTEKAFGAHGDRLANIGIFLGISLLSSVVIVTQWAPSGVEPSRLWVHTIVALALAQLAIISGLSFKSIGRANSQASTRRPARYVKAQRRIEPQLIQPKQPEPEVPKIESKPASTGTLNGKTYVLYTDGACEIDTLFGRRRFEDLDSARVFVGG